MSQVLRPATRGATRQAAAEQAQAKLGRGEQGAPDNSNASSASPITVAPTPETPAVEVEVAAVGSKGSLVSPSADRQRSKVNRGVGDVSLGGDEDEPAAKFKVSVRTQRQGVGVGYQVWGMKVVCWFVW